MRAHSPGRRQGIEGPQRFQRCGSTPEDKRYGLGSTTPKEMVTLLEKLERGEAVSAAASREMIAILKRQQFKEGIGRHLDDEWVASKSGSLDALRSDVGLVYAPKARSTTCPASIMPQTMPETSSSATWRRCCSKVSARWTESERIASEDGSAWLWSTLEGTQVHPIWQKNPRRRKRKPKRQPPAKLRFPPRQSRRRKRRIRQRPSAKLRLPPRQSRRKTRRRDREFLSWRKRTSPGCRGARRRPFRRPLTSKRGTA